MPIKKHGLVEVMKRHSTLLQAIVALLFSLRSRGGASSRRTRVYSSISTNVAFGALLPLHLKDHLGGCDKLKDDKGSLWLSALNYAVDDVNRKWKRQLNTTLTLKVRDTCGDEQIALEQALDFADGYRNASDSTFVRQANKADNSTPVLSVISVSLHEDASTLLSLFRVPQIIFGRGITRVEKPAKDILHSISVSFYKAKALADLVKHFSWSAVSVIYSLSHKDDFESFRRISRIENLCIAVEVALGTAGKTDNSQPWESAVNELLSEPQSTVIVLFTEEEETKELLKTVKQKKYPPVYLTWILTSEKNAMCFFDNPDDILMLLPQFPFLEGFRNYFKDDNTHIALRNILDSRSVSPKTCLNAVMMESPKRTKEEIQASMNSVYLLAHAYETATQTVAGRLDRAVFARSLGYVHQVLYSENSKLFSDQRSMKQNMFSLIHVRLNGSTKSLFNVGTWDNSWYINDIGIKWRSHESPRSFCGVQCSPGHVRVVKGNCKCCWSCLACHYNQIVTDEYTCADCLRGYWPNEDFSKCEFQWRRTLIDCTLAIVAVVFVFSFMVL